MSEYEMLDAMIGAFGLGISAIVFYFTVLSSYLIVAHFAGAKLAGFQIAIITGLFILAALFGVWSSTSFLINWWHLCNCWGFWRRSSSCGILGIRRLIETSQER
jgi:hypothetical protein